MFDEDASQQRLFEPGPDEPRGPFAFHPVAEEPFSDHVPVSLAFTHPFKFIHTAPATPPPLPETSVATLTLPPPETVTAAPIPSPTRESAVRDIFEREVIREALRKVIPPPEAPTEAASEAPAPPVDEPKGMLPAPPLEVLEPEAQPDVSIPEPALATASVGESLPRITIPPSWESRPATAIGWRWILWVSATAALLIGLIFFGFWLMDVMTSREAIRSVKPVEPLVTKTVADVPKPAVVMPVAPPAPKAKPPQRVPIVKTPSVKPVPKPVVQKAPAPVAVKPSVKPVVLPVAPKPVTAPPVAAPAPTPLDRWKDRQNEAIQQTMAFRIIRGQVTIGDHAKMMLHQMHDKELLHAAETGLRLYLPDKMNWSSLREDGARYRVYLNFSAILANGERHQTHSYQFIIHLDTGKVDTDDTATRQDFLSATQRLSAPRSALAKDLDNILSGVDALNRQKLRGMVMGHNKKNKVEARASEKAIEAARAQVRKSIVYFRTQHTEKALQNAAQAYSFAELLQ